ncbi:MAG: hypothetical protein GC182_15845 [Rhodopseudomonas sp.]|nr:hypothetical protein [Rhodopseudomonas sp.]
MADGQAASPKGSAPTPDPSPRFARASGGGEQTDLTAKVRALYEGSAVPVREIARLVGVTERTIYKYVAKGCWNRRYRRGLNVAPAFVPVRGAGGRFTRRADKDAPVAQGLKATDPDGRARAAAACDGADRVARVAFERAQARWRCAARWRAIDVTNRALAELNGFYQARRAAAAQKRNAEKQAEKNAAKRRPPGTFINRFQVPPQRASRMSYQAASHVTCVEPDKEPGKEPGKPIMPARPGAGAGGRTAARLDNRAEGILVRAVEIALGRWAVLLAQDAAG